MTHAPWLAVQLQWMRASGVQRVAFFCTVLGLAGVLTGSLIKRDASNVESALMRARQERAERIAHGIDDMLELGVGFYRAQDGGLGAGIGITGKAFVTGVDTDELGDELEAGGARRVDVLRG